MAASTLSLRLNAACPAASLASSAMCAKPQQLRLAAHSSRVVMSAEAKEAPRAGSKEPSQETLLTPRFYTTDFDEMEQVRGTPGVTFIPPGRRNDVKPVSRVA